MDNFVILIFVIYFGLSIGSFLNVVIYRTIKEISIISPPSFCPVCKNPIKWYDNIPVISYILLKGKCRRCSSEIPITYPLIELLTGLITVLLYLKWWKINIWWCIGSCMISYLLIVISVIDIKTMMLSDLFSYILAGLGVIFSAVNPMFVGNAYERILSSISGIIAGASFMYILLVIGKAIYKKDTVGEGDVFLLGAIGGVVGTKGIFDVIVISSLFGSVYGLSMIMFSKLSRHSYIPFGPFLASACLIKIYIPFKLINLFT